MLDERDWTFLLSGATLVTFKPTEVIITEGEEFKYFYRLKTGVVGVEKKLPNEQGTK
jgi:hypothetical protein